MISRSSPIRMGLLKPNSVIELAIWRTCFLEWVRALPLYGRSSDTGIVSTVSIRKSPRSGVRWDWAEEEWRRQLAASYRSALAGAAAPTSGRRVGRRRHHDQRQGFFWCATYLLHNAIVLLRGYVAPVPFPLLVIVHVVLEVLKNPFGRQALTLQGILNLAVNDGGRRGDGHGLAILPHSHRSQHLCQEALTKEPVVDMVSPRDLWPALRITRAPLYPPPIRSSRRLCGRLGLPIQGVPLATRLFRLSWPDVAVVQ